MELHVALSMRLDAVEAYRLAHAYRDEVLAKNGDAVERDCLAMAVLFARQWSGGTPFELHKGIDEILATMPATGEKATAPAATATPDFFQPDHTYRRDEWEFRCHGTGPHPITGERHAFGWKVLGADDEDIYTLHPASLDAEAWDRGWTDVTEAGAE